MANLAFSPYLAFGHSQQVMMCVAMISGCMWLSGIILQLGDAPNRGVKTMAAASASHGSGSR